MRAGLPVKGRIAASENDGVLGVNEESELVLTLLDAKGNKVAATREMARSPWKISVPEGTVWDMGLPVPTSTTRTTAPFASIPPKLVSFQEDQIRFRKMKLLTQERLPGIMACQIVLQNDGKEFLCDELKVAALRVTGVELYCGDERLVRAQNRSHLVNFTVQLVNHNERFNVASPVTFRASAARPVVSLRGDAILLREVCLRYVVRCRARNSVCGVQRLPIQTQVDTDGCASFGNAVEIRAASAGATKIGVRVAERGQAALFSCELELDVVPSGRAVLLKFGVDGETDVDVPVGTTGSLDVPAGSSFRGAQVSCTDESGAPVGPARILVDEVSSGKHVGAFVKNGSTYSLETPAAVTFVFPTQTGGGSTRTLRFYAGDASRPTALCRCASRELLPCCSCVSLGGGAQRGVSCRGWTYERNTCRVSSCAMRGAS